MQAAVEGRGLLGEDSHLAIGTLREKRGLDSNGEVDG